MKKNVFALFLFFCCFFCFSEVKSAGKEEYTKNYKLAVTLNIVWGDFKLGFNINNQYYKKDGIIFVKKGTCLSDITVDSLPPYFTSKIYWNNDEISDGTVTINNNGILKREIRIEDIFGNSDSESITFNFVVDDEKPNINIQNLTENWGSSDRNLSFTITDEKTGVYRKKLSVNDKDIGFVENYKISEEGINTITVSADDNVLNHSEKTVKVRIDKTNPTVSITNTVPTGWNTKEVTLSVKASDSVSGVKSITVTDTTDGKTVTIRPEKNNIGTPDIDNGIKEVTQEYVIKDSGEHSLKIEVEDYAGNKCTYSPNPLTVKVDKAAPNIITEGYKQGDWTKEDVTVSAEDTHSKIKSFVIKDEKNNTVTGKKLTATGTYTVTATDNAGNTSEKTIQIDKTSPKITINTGAYTEGDWTKSNVQIAVTLNDELSGINNETIGITDNYNGNQSTITQFVETIENGKLVRTFTLSENGEHKITVEAEDNAGNSKTVSTGTIKIDNEKIASNNISITPVYSDSVNQYRQKLNCGNVTAAGNIEELQITVNENENNISKPDYATVNGEKIDFADGSMAVVYDVKNLDSGSYPYKFEVTDKAGNISDEKTFSFTIDRDTDIPTSSLIHQVEESSDKNKVEIIYNQNSGKDTKYLLIYNNENDSGNPDRSTVINLEGEESKRTISITKNTDGVYPIYVEGADIYGNHKSETLYVLWRNGLDTPTVNWGCETTQENGIKSYIEIPVQAAPSITVGGKDKSFTRIYKYFGTKYTNKSETVDSSSNKIYIENLKQYLNWNDAEKGRKITVYYTEEYTPGTDETNIYAEKGESNRLEYLVKDSKPVFNKNITWPEYATEKIIPKITKRDVNTGLNFAADPDGDPVRYKITLTDGKNTDVSYKNNITEGIGIPKKLDVSKGITIKIEAKGITTAGSGTIDEKSWNNDPAESSVYDSKSYTSDKIDIIAPEVTADDANYWTQYQNEWTNIKTANFTFRDNGSGIKNVSVEYKKDETRINTKDIILDCVNEYTYTADFGNENLTGSYYVYFTVTDAAGNTSTVSRGPVKIDTRKPEIKNVEPVIKADGLVELTVEATDNNGSGFKQYRYKEKSSDKWCDWTPYPANKKINIPSGLFTKKAREIQLQLKDNALNESLVFDCNCGDYEPVPEITDFTFTGINERGFVTDVSSFNYNVAFAGGSNISQYTTEWILKDINENIVTGSPFNSFASLKKKLTDGNEYKISVKVKNKYGNQKEKTSDTIIKVKTSVPDPICLTTDTEIKKGIKHNITVTGGTGGERTVVLFSKDSKGKRTILHTYRIGDSLNSTSVSFPTENFNNEIESGITYLYARSENEAGLFSESVERGPLSLVEFEGLAVYADAYTSGTLHVYWTDSEDTAKYYKYYLESEDQQIGEFIQTEIRNADIEIPEGYDSGTKFAVTVKSYSADNILLNIEKSNDSTYWKKQPELKFTNIPSAVTSSGIKIEYECTDIIGINRRQYAFEIYEKDAETNSWEWNGLEEDGNRKWIDLNSETEIYDISVLKELKKDSRITNGSRIRVCLKIENNAELYSQIETNAITVDETEPPVPIICDQGDVINQTKESISADWSTSTNDPESGSTYFWRWYYSGEDNFGVSWNEAEWNENRTEQTKHAEITAGDVNNPINDGKIIIFEVKAVNGAGLETIAVTDGIKLDSNSPWIENFHIYTSETKKEMIGTYIKQKNLGDYVYVSFTANDVTSGIAKAEVILCEIDDAGQHIEKSTIPLNCNENEISGNINISNTISKEIGKRFLIKVAVEDQAGNKYVKSANSIIQIIGNPVEIKQIDLKGDKTGISINWMTEGNINWTREYVIVITYSRQTSNSKTYFMSETLCSKTWADLGIEYKNLSSSDYFTVKIKPIGLLSENGKEEQRTLTIDLEEPVFDQTKKRIPEESGLTAWADEITAYVKYKMQISTGTIEWSAWENDIMLVDWQTKKNADSLTIRKNVEELSEIRSKVYWQNKYITLKFRAMNAMGISSTVKEVSCFIDMTPPESVAVSRNWVWTNSFDNLDNIKITGKDGDSGIVSYVSALIPKNIIDKVGIETAIKQNSIESIYSYHSKDQSLSIENIQIPIKGTEEGIYNAVVGIRNGSGIWKYEKSADITVDRTSPSLNRNDSFFNGKHLAKTIIDGKETNIFIVNDENTSLTFRASEESKWSITGEGNLFTGITEQEYKAEINKNINFSGKTEGTVYRLNVELTDKAGNIKTETIYVRYNKAPVVKIKYDDTGVPDERKIIVWPGHSKSIKELFEVSDKEDLSEGDYPLTFKWTSGTGDQSIIWTGGNSKENVFGTNRDYATTYVQRDRESQVSEYTGTLQVTDCHGKSREITVTVTVENTRNGLLLVDEYWTGEHEVNGMIEIPEGRTLTLSDVNVTMSGYSAGDYVNSGFDVKGILHAQGTVSLNKKSNLSKFKGITVQGNLSGESISINGAKRGITLLPFGQVDLNQLNISDCTTGMHLLGGTLSEVTGTITGCEEYGIKVDGNGTYSYGGMTITDCGRRTYIDGKAE